MSIPKRYGDDPITKKLYSTWCGIKTRCYNPKQSSQIRENTRRSTA